MTSIKGRAFGSAILLFALCPGCRSVSENLIVPGVRVGQVVPDSTAASLRAAFGAQAVMKLLPGDDLNDEEYVTILYENEPSRKLTVGWEDKSASHLRYVRVCGNSVQPLQCVWHTDGGIRMGLTLQELERRNGRPFSVGSWQTDFDPGSIKSWDGGMLAKPLDGVYLSLCFPPGAFPEEMYSIETLPTPSNHPILQRLNPILCEIVVALNER